MIVSFLIFSVFFQNFLYFNSGSTPKNSFSALKELTIHICLLYNRTANFDKNRINYAARNGLKRKRMEEIMNFNLNDFLTAVSFALDFVEMDRLGMRSNHGKRTAYIALCLAGKLGLSKEEQYDTAALALMHDNGLSESSLYERTPDSETTLSKKYEGSKGHCIIGEKNIENYPFLSNPEQVILYHHEHIDGSGFFGLSGNEIPFMAQIIGAADRFENHFKRSSGISIKDVLDWISIHTGNLFSEDIAKAFSSIAKKDTTWISLKDDNVEQALLKAIPDFSLECSFEQIRQITSVFSKIIDSKSSFTQRHSKGLSEKAAHMADYYKKDATEKIKLIIAADLHDLGKLAVPNSILDSPRALTPEEFELVKKHVYYTRIALQKIKGFEDITEWAANHHEKLNGKGYPFGKTGKDLDFNSRLMACLDMYQAITEERPYRKGMSHQEAMKILNNMKDMGMIDPMITMNIDQAFS